MYLLDVSQAEEPITLQEARVQLRIDAPDGAEHHEDDQVLSLVTAARQAAEAFTTRMFARRECELVLDCLPGRICLPVTPVVELVAATYLDVDGVEQALDLASYRLYAHPDAPELIAVSSPDLPAVQSVRGAVRMRLLVGYGEGAPAPRAAVQAMLLTVGHLYANREDVVVGASAVDLPQGSKALLWPYRRGLGV